MSDTRECPIDGCAARHDTRYLMCGTHWRMVPKELQAEVYGRARRMFDDEAAYDLWEEACSKAIAAVEEKESEYAGLGKGAGRKSEGEPNSQLTAIGEELVEKACEQDCRGFLMLSRDREDHTEGGITQFGYDDYGSAMYELQEHVTRMFEAHGFKVQFLTMGQN